MNLEHVQEQLSAYLDGELEGAARARVEAHVSACAACREELEELRALDVDLRRLPEPEPGPQYWSRFVQRVEARLPARPATGPAAPFERVAGWLFPSGRLGWLRPAGVLLTATFLTYVGLHGYRSKLDVPSETPQGSVPQFEAPKTSGTIDEVKKGIEPPPPTPPAATEQFARKPSVAGEDMAKPSSGEAKTEPVTPVPDLAMARETRSRESAIRSGQAVAPTESRDLTVPGEGAPRPGATAPGVGSWAARPRPSVQPDVTARVQGESAEGALRPPTPPADYHAVIRSDKVMQQQGPTGDELHLRRKTAEASPRGRILLGAGQERSAAPEEDEVAKFVAAAVAGDTAAARRAFGAFEARHLATADPQTHREMQAWFAASQAEGAPGTAAETREGVAASRAEGPGPPSDLEALLALDGLVWPRREIPFAAGGSVSPPGAAIEEAMRYLARQFAARAASDGRARDRARQYLEWLVARGAGPERSEWEALLRRLP